MPGPSALTVTAQLAHLAAKATAAAQARGSASPLNASTTDAATACPVVNRAFAAGRCIATIDWDWAFVLDLGSNSSSLHGVLGAALLPGSTAVSVRGAAGGLPGPMLPCTAPTGAHSLHCPFAAPAHVPGQAATSSSAVAPGSPLPGEHSGSTTTSSTGSSGSEAKQGLPAWVSRAPFSIPVAPLVYKVVSDRGPLGGGIWGSTYRSLPLVVPSAAELGSGALIGEHWQASLAQYLELRQAALGAWANLAGPSTISTKGRQGGSAGSSNASSSSPGSAASQGQAIAAFSQAFGMGSMDTERLLAALQAASTHGNAAPKGLRAVLGEVAKGQMWSSVAAALKSLEKPAAAVAAAVDAATAGGSVGPQGLEMLQAAAEAEAARLEARWEVALGYAAAMLGLDGSSGSAGRAVLAQVFSTLLNAFAAESNTTSAAPHPPG